MNRECKKLLTFESESNNEPKNALEQQTQMTLKQCHKGSFYGKGELRSEVREKQNDVRSLMEMLGKKRAESATSCIPLNRKETINQKQQSTKGCD